MLIPGNVAGVAKQFLRCMFHQLAPNGILPQLFQSNIKGPLLPLMTQLKRPSSLLALSLWRRTGEISPARVSMSFPYLVAQLLYSEQVSLILLA